MNRNNQIIAETLCSLLSSLSSAKEAELIEDGCPDTQKNMISNRYWLALEWMVHYDPQSIFYLLKNHILSSH